jgi:YegS/Rv2252/BmrU family lipid kinase
MEWIEPLDYSKPGRIIAPERPDSCMKSPTPIPECPAVLENDQNALKNVNIRSCLVVLNPNAGGGNGEKIFRQIQRDLEELKVKFDVEKTKHAGHAAEICSKVGKEQYDMILIVGGDGTIHEVVNALMEVEKENRPALAMLPAGTGCNVQRSLKLGVKDTVQAIRNGNVVYLDVGKIQYGADFQNKRYFFNCLSWGIAGDSLLLAEKSFFRTFGRFRYDIAGFCAIAKGKKRKSELEIDGNRPISDPSVILAMVNQHGGNEYRICPYAVMNDGFFDIAVVGDCDKFSFTKLMLDLKTKSALHLYNKNCSFFRSKKFSVSSTPESPINLDGENICTSPVHVEMLSQQIPILFLSL